MDHSTITFHRLEEHHLDDVKSLFRIVFNKKVSVEYLKAKYNTDYVRKSHLCSIAYDGDKPIAFYGALPQRFASDKTSFLVAHACDSFTLKEYQGQGIHYKLALLAYELMKQNSVKMVYAFHSENTFHSTKKLGWLTHHHLERFHIPIKTIPKAKISKKIGLTSRYQKDIYQRLKPLESKSQFSFKSAFEFHQQYNSSFLIYKNSFYAHYHIELNDCQFFLKVDAIMQIGFFSFSTEENLQLAVKSLIKICSEAGISEILFQVTPHSIMSEALKKFIVPQQSWLLGYLPFEELNISDFEFTFADLDTF